MTDLQNPERHPAYGILTFQRVTHGTSSDLFGSAIRHQHTIHMEVSEAARHRTAGTDLILAQRRLLIADLSHTQFTDAITNMNQSTGTPITLRFVQGDQDQRPDPPPPTARADLDHDFEAMIAKVTAELDELIEHPRLPAAARRKAQGIKQQLTNTAPFLRDQFARQMDHTVTEAKAEITAYTEQHRANQADTPPELPALEQPPPD